MGLMMVSMYGEYIWMMADLPNGRFIVDYTTLQYTGGYTMWDPDYDS